MTDLVRATAWPKSLWEFIRALVDVEVVLLSDDPPWFEPSRVYEVDESIYSYFLEVLPPRWIQGNWFAFGEGAGPFRLFWQVNNAFFARELTEVETHSFCALSRVSLYV